MTPVIALAYLYFSVGIVACIVGVFLGFAASAIAFPYTLYGMLVLIFVGTSIFLLSYKRSWGYLAWLTAMALAGVHLYKVGRETWTPYIQTLSRDESVTQIYHDPGSETLRTLAYVHLALAIIGLAEFVMVVLLRARRRLTSTNND